MSASATCRPMPLPAPVTAANFPAAAMARYPPLRCCALVLVRREPVANRRPLSSVHHLQHAAIDVVGRADAVAGTVGTQEDEEVGDLLRAGEALDGRVLVGDALDVVPPGPIRALR